MRSRHPWTSFTTSTPSTIERLAARHAQGDVQDGSVLGHVELLAGEHRFDAIGKARALGEGREELQGFSGRAVLRVIEVQVGGLERHGVATRGIAGEEFAQILPADLDGMREQGRPLDRFVDRFGHAPRCSSRARA